MANICYARHCSKHSVLYLLILRRAYEVYAIIIPILQTKLLGSKVTL